MESDREELIDTIGFIKENLISKDDLPGVIRDEVRAVLDELITLRIGAIDRRVTSVEQELRSIHETLRDW